MPEVQTMTIRCAQCGQPSPLEVRSIIDAQDDPQGKALLLNDQLNAGACPHCGFTNKASAPLLYHDATKDLLIAYIPMEMGLQKGAEEERIVGDLMNQLTREIPRENFKAYMFNPKRALTLNGVIEQIMEADGVTPEMIEEQKKRIELAQRMMEAPTDDLRIEIIRNHDDDIDTAFFQTISVMARRAMEDGRQDIAGQLLAVQQALLDHSSLGQEIAASQPQEETIRAVAEEIQALGPEATRDDLVELALRYADDDHKLQSLVGLARPAFDYEFFQTMTTRIEATPADDRDLIESVRQRLVELTQIVDQQMQESVRQAAALLQEMLDSADPQTILQQNAHLIDDDFMTVLAANIQEAERRGHSEASAQLRSIYDMIVDMLQSQMPPEMRFINDLLSAENAAARQQIMTANQGAYDESLLDVIDEIEKLLKAQGHSELIDRLGTVRSELKQTLG